MIINAFRDLRLYTSPYGAQTQSIVVILVLLHYAVFCDTDLFCNSSVMDPTIRESLQNMHNLPDGPCFDGIYS